MELHPWHSMRPATRHSLVLVVAGHVYGLVGVSYIITEATATRYEALKVATNVMPIQAWGLVFILVGILSVISSRWPPASETWGYTCMTGLSVGWAGFYGMGVLLGSAPQNLSGVLVWGLLGFLWWAVSGLVNPAMGEAHRIHPAPIRK